MFSTLSILLGVWFKFALPWWPAKLSIFHIFMHLSWEVPIQVFCLFSIGLPIWFVEIFYSEIILPHFVDYIFIKIMTYVSFVLFLALEIKWWSHFSLHD